MWSAGTRGTPDTLDARRDVFVAGKPYLWSATAPTPPPVPVADLIDIARDDQQIPTPVVELNPAGQTVTGLRTWVWSTGQRDDATDCYVTFRRSSAGLPGGTATVNVAVTWTVRLTTSDGINNGDLGTIVRSGQVRIGVAEVQSVLR